MHMIKSGWCFAMPAAAAVAAGGYRVVRKSANCGAPSARALRATCRFVLLPRCRSFPGPEAAVTVPPHAFCS